MQDKGDRMTRVWCNMAARQCQNATCSQQMPALQPHRKQMTNASQLLQATLCTKKNITLKKRERVRRLPRAVTSRRTFFETISAVVTQEFVTQLEQVKERQAAAQNMRTATGKHRLVWSLHSDLFTSGLSVRSWRSGPCRAVWSVHGVVFNAGRCGQ